MHQNTSQFTLAKTQPCRLTQFMEEELEEMALLTAEPAISIFFTIFYKKCVKVNLIHFNLESFCYIFVTSFNICFIGFFFRKNLKVEE